jgi:hypothetical protein
VQLWSQLLRSCRVLGAATEWLYSTPASKIKNLLTTAGQTIMITLVLSVGRISCAVMPSPEAVIGPEEASSVASHTGDLAFSLSGSR